ncbi:hypothetical protein INR49_015335 [Caranx melampygus]|nr:hypothetical protein INR49_015335 [Caranx melampygus]
MASPFSVPGHPPSPPLYPGPAEEMLRLTLTTGGGASSSSSEGLEWDFFSPPSSSSSSTAVSAHMALSNRFRSAVLNTPLPVFCMFCQASSTWM